MKRLAVLFLLLLAGITNTKAQTVSDTTKNKCYTIDGTYQIQVLHPRAEPLIPANINKIVLDNRDATQVKYVAVGTMVRIKILPLSEINRPDFKPLERIKHVSE